jgi:hypothetical protein
MSSICELSLKAAQVERTKNTTIIAIKIINSVVIVQIPLPVYCD